MKYKYKDKILGSSTFKMAKSSKFKYLSEILHSPVKYRGVKYVQAQARMC